MGLRPIEMGKIFAKQRFVGHDCLIALAGLSDAPMLGQVKILAVENDLHGTVRPQLGHIQEPIEFGARKNIFDFLLSTGNMYGALFEDRAEEFLGRNRRDDLPECRIDGNARVLSGISRRLRLPRGGRRDRP